MVNHSKTNKAKCTQRLYCEWNKRELGLKETRRYRRNSRKARKVRKRGKRGDWWRWHAWEQNGSRLPPLFMTYQKAQELSLVQRRIPGVGLEEQRVVVKWSEEMLAYHSALTIFGSSGSFLCLFFLLLYLCFVILIKYSRIQKGNQELHSHYPSLLL